MRKVSALEKRFRQFLRSLGYPKTSAAVYVNTMNKILSDQKCKNFHDLAVNIDSVCKDYMPGGSRTAFATGGYGNHNVECAIKLFKVYVNNQKIKVQ